MKQKIFTKCFAAALAVCVAISPLHTNAAVDTSGENGRTYVEVDYTAPTAPVNPHTTSDHTGYQDLATCVSKETPVRNTVTLYAGNYYLSSDFECDYTIEFRADDGDEVTICLNGYQLSCELSKTSDAPIISVTDDDMVINICDCCDDNSNVTYGYWEKVTGTDPNYDEYYNYKYNLTDVKPADKTEEFEVYEYIESWEYDTLYGGIILGGQGPTIKSINDIVVNVFDGNIVGKYEGTVLLTDIQDRIEEQNPTFDIEYATLNICGGVFAGNTSMCDNAHVHGYELEYNNVYGQPVIYANNVNMFDGAICHNIAEYSCGVGVYTQENFYMKSGKINDNIMLAWEESYSSEDIYMLNGGSSSNICSGGAVYMTDGIFVMDGGTISDNICQGSAVFLDDCEGLSVKNATFSGNTNGSIDDVSSSDEGEGVSFIENTTFTGGRPTYSYLDGMIYAEPYGYEISYSGKCYFDNVSVTNGTIEGAMYLTGDMFLNDVTVKNNRGEFAGIHTREGIITLSGDTEISNNICTQESIYVSGGGVVLEKESAVNDVELRIMSSNVKFSGNTRDVAVGTFTQLVWETDPTYDVTVSGLITFGEDFTTNTPYVLNVECYGDVDRTIEPYMNCVTFMENVPENVRVNNLNTDILFIEDVSKTVGSRSIAAVNPEPHIVTGDDRYYIDDKSENHGKIEYQWYDLKMEEKEIADSNISAQLIEYVRIMMGEGAPEEEIEAMAEMLKQQGAPENFSTLVDGYYTNGFSENTPFLFVKEEVESGDIITVEILDAEDAIMVAVFSNAEAYLEPLGDNMYSFKAPEAGTFVIVSDVLDIKIGEMTRATYVFKEEAKIEGATSQYIDVDSISTSEALACKVVYRYNYGTQNTPVHISQDHTFVSDKKYVHAHAGNIYTELAEDENYECMIDGEVVEDYVLDGYYYLSSNLEYTYPEIEAGKSVVICLNGKFIDEITVNENGKLEIVDCSNGTSGYVYGVYADGEFILNGGRVCEVYMSEGNPINIAGAVKAPVVDDENESIYLYDISADQVVAKPYNGYTITYEDANKFADANGDYVIVLLDGNLVAKAPSVEYVTFNADNNALNNTTSDMEYCINDGEWTSCKSGSTELTTLDSVIKAMGKDDVVKIKVRMAGDETTESVVVEIKTNSTVADIKVEKVTATTVTLTENALYEYGIVDANGNIKWQDSNVFEHLKEGVEYKFVARIKGLVDTTVTPYVYNLPGAVSETVAATPKGEEVHKHSYGDYVSDNNASMLQNGTETATCPCGQTITREIEGSMIKADMDSVVEDEKEIGTNGGSISIKVNTDKNLPTVNIDNLDMTLVQALVTEEEMERVEAGDKVLVYLDIRKMVTDTPAADKNSAEALLDSKLKDGVVGMYFDLSLFKKVGDDAAYRITETGDKAIEVVLSVPDELKNTDEKITRKYYILRVHEGKAELLETTYADGKLTFTTDCFSTYAIVYADSSNATSPDLGYSFPVVACVSIMLMAVVCMALLKTNNKKTA